MYYTIYEKLKLREKSIYYLNINKIDEKILDRFPKLFSFKLGIYNGNKVELSLIEDVNI